MSRLRRARGAAPHGSRPTRRGIVLAVVSDMKIRQVVVGLAVAVSALAPAAPAGAEDGPRTPPWALRFEPGGFFTPDHLHRYGLVGMPPPLYLGVSLERTIVGPVRANVSGGASFMLGWLVGGTVRYLAIDAESAN